MNLLNNINFELFPSSVFLKQKRLKIYACPLRFNFFLSLNFYIGLKEYLSINIDHHFKKYNRKRKKLINNSYKYFPNFVYPLHNEYVFTKKRFILNLKKKRKTRLKELVLFRFVTLLRVLNLKKILNLLNYFYYKDPQSKNILLTSQLNFFLRKSGAKNSGLIFRFLGIHSFFLRRNRLLKSKRLYKIGTLKVKKYYFNNFRSNFFYLLRNIHSNYFFKLFFSNESLSRFTNILFYKQSFFFLLQMLRDIKKFFQFFFLFLKKFYNYVKKFKYNKFLIYYYLASYIYLNLRRKLFKSYNFLFKLNYLYSKNLDLNLNIYSCINSLGLKFKYNFFSNFFKVKMISKLIRGHLSNRGLLPSESVFYFYKLKQFYTKKKIFFLRYRISMAKYIRKSLRCLIILRKNNIKNISPNKRYFNNRNKTLKTIYSLKFLHLLNNHTKKLNLDKKGIKNNIKSLLNHNPIILKKKINILKIKNFGRIFKQSKKKKHLKKFFKRIRYIRLLEKVSRRVLLRKKVMSNYNLVPINFKNKFKNLK